MSFRGVSIKKKSGARDFRPQRSSTKKASMFSCQRQFKLKLYKEEGTCRLCLPFVPNTFIDLADWDSPAIYNFVKHLPIGLDGPVVTYFFLGCFNRRRRAYHAEGYIIILVFLEGVEKKQRSLFGFGGAQRHVLRVNKPKKTGARSATLRSAAKIH